MDDLSISSAIMESPLDSWLDSETNETSFRSSGRQLIRPRNFDRIRAIQELPTPTSIKKIHSMVGVAIFLRWFVPLFGKGTALFL